MDASRKIQDGIHELSIDHKSMCPGIWVHIISPGFLFFSNFLSFILSCVCMMGTVNEALKERMTVKMAKELETKAAETEEITAAAEKTEGKKKKKSRKRRIVKRLICTLVILLVVGVAVWSIYSKLMAEYKITYDPYTATTGSISNSLSFTGSMQLINSATYTAPSDCKVKEIYVAEGDQVKEGDKLMRLSGGETIEAEFDGTVSSINVEKGDEIKAETTLMTVADFDHMVVSVRVGESNIGQVSEGQSCRVTVSSAGATFDAVIDDIDHVSYSGNNVAYYTTKVNVDTSGTEGI